jgi:hypothetical protein
VNPSSTTPSEAEVVGGGIEEIVEEMSYPFDTPSDQGRNQGG